MFTLTFVDLEYVYT